MLRMNKMFHIQIESIFPICLLPILPQTFFVFKKNKIRLLLLIDKECACLAIKTNSLSKDNQILLH